jgi:glycosyltransferase involved in cell wall biosynthesis
MRFNLPDAAKVVIHAGSLGDWTGIEELVQSAPEWPEPWVLVVHTRYDAESSEYVERLRRMMDPTRVFLSLKPVPRQDYDALIDGADVGLAFYMPDPTSAFTQQNLLTLGLSSGKLAYYLRAGLPVIVNRDASIAKEVENHGIGVAVQNAHEVSAALQCVQEDYQRFSDSALMFFDEHLDFRRAFTEVLRRVDALQ